MNFNKHDWIEIYLFLVLLFRGSSGELRQSMLLKVSNMLPVKVENCFLEELTLFAEDLKTGCVARCNMSPECNLACRKDRQCRLYDANVSPHWPGGTPASSDLGGFECFSRWAERQDLVLDVTNVSVTSQATSPGQNAISGFACKMANENNFLVTSLTNNAWIVFDLGSSLQVDRVVVQTRGNINGLSNFFEDVEVKVGDGGNFVNNELLMNYPGPSSYGEVVIFKGLNSLRGRYVSVQQKMQQSQFCIMEVKILPP